MGVEEMGTVDRGRISERPTIRTQTPTRGSVHDHVIPEMDLCFWLRFTSSSYHHPPPSLLRRNQNSIWILF
jgi:hypothetical protein